MEHKDILGCLTSRKSQVSIEIIPALKALLMIERWNQYLHKNRWAQACTTPYLLELVDTCCHTAHYPLTRD